MSIPILQRTFVVLATLLLTALPAYGQAQGKRGARDSAAVAGPVSPDSADALRGAMERPPNSHSIGLGDVVNAPFELALYPLKLLADGTTWAVGELLEVEPAGKVERLARTLEGAGLRPGLSTDLGPRGGLGLELVYDDLRPLVLETAGSHRGSQRHAVALEWGAEARRLRVEGSFRRYAEPWVWGVGMGFPDEARADYEWDRVAATAVLELARRDRTIHELLFRVGVEENAVEGGSDDGVPDIGEAFPPGALPGAEDLTRFAFVEAGAEFDVLDRDTLEISGLRAGFDLEGYEGLAHTRTRFLRARGEVEGIVPVTDRHLFSVRTRVAASREDGGPIPFTHLAELGGDEGLRAYGSGRFRDRDLFTVGAEWRWEVWRELRERGRIEAFLFYAEGGVAHDLAEDLPDLVDSKGVGLRFLWLGEYQGEGYLAFGEDGPRVGASLDLELGR